MSRNTENAGFTCDHCGSEVVPLTNGSYRNHCPLCLYSKHVDLKPGDRQNDCGGLMRPIGFRHKGGKGIQLIHQCLLCGVERVNRVSRDTVQPDDIDALVALSSL
jgi:hypothetical protein